MLVLYRIDLTLKLYVGIVQSRLNVETLCWYCTK